MNLDEHWLDDESLCTSQCTGTVPYCTILFSLCSGSESSYPVKHSWILRLFDYYMADRRLNKCYFTEKFFFTIKCFRMVPYATVPYCTIDCTLEFMDILWVFHASVHLEVRFAPYCTVLIYKHNTPKTCLVWKLYSFYSYGTVLVPYGTI